MAHDILITIAIGIVVGGVTNLVAHYLAMQRAKQHDADCDDDSLVHKVK